MKKLFLIPLYLSFAFVCVSSVFARTNVGYVMEMRGNWQLNGNTSLRQSQKLPASGVISIKSPGRYDYIKIADLNGTVRIEKKCTKDCEFKLPDAPVKTSYLGELLSTIMGMIWSESPNRYSAHRSRSEEFKDGIVKTDDGKIDLSSLVKPPENSFVQWRKISPKAEEKHDDWSEPPVELTAGKNGAVVISAADLRPGLYEFKLIESLESSIEPPNTAWILVTSVKDYKQNVKSFEQVKELNKTLGEDIKPETAQMFIRAYLDHLARQRMR